MAMYPNLKLQLWRSGVRQNRLAQLVGIHETLLSRIVNGFRPAGPEIRSRIAATLKCDEAWLFAVVPNSSGTGQCAPPAYQQAEVSQDRESRQAGTSRPGFTVRPMQE
jgi:hypothetical protein